MGILGSPSNLGKSKSSGYMTTGFVLVYNLAWPAMASRVLEHPAPVL